MQNAIRTSCYYFHEREVLYVPVDTSTFLIDYYLHVKRYVPDLKPEHDEKLKELMACFAAHLTLRPATETHAWTVHIHAEQPFSLFVTGEAERGFLVGHVLSDEIRHTDVNIMHAQVSIRGEIMRSSVQAESSEPHKIVEHFYDQSEQLPIRFHQVPNSDSSLALAAMPGYDAEWFHSVELSELDKIIASTRKEMRTCTFRFFCDCSPEKLLPFFKSIDPTTVEELYGTDSALIISCPRCGKIFELHRDQVFSSS